MKALLLKILAGLIAVAALQVPLGYFLCKPDYVPEHQDLRTIEPSTEALLLGDSVLGYETKDDPGSLLALIRRRSRLPVRSLDGPGYTPELQFALLDHALRQGYVPRIVVASVNLRCFSEPWDQGLQYQFSEWRARLHHGDVLALGFQKPMSSYHIYATLEGFPRSPEDYQKILVTREGRRLGTIDQVLDRSRQRTPEARGTAFALLYQNSLEPSHRKIRALRNLAALCRSKAIPLRLYITPLDIESGARFAGAEFRPRVEGNIQVLRAALEDHDLVLENWSSLLRADQFSYGDYPNEHLNSSGREKLAEEVTRLIGSAQIR